VLDNIAKWNEQFIKDFGIHTESASYQNLMAVNMGAASIANEHNITNYAIEQIYRETVLKMIEIRDKVQKVNRADYPSLSGRLR